MIACKLGVSEGKSGKGLSLFIAKLLTFFAKLAAKQSKIR
jgi:hypothetical protein